MFPAWTDVCYGLLRTSGFALAVGLLVAWLLQAVLKTKHQLEPLAALYVAHNEVGVPSEVVGILSLNSSPDAAHIKHVVLERLLKVPKMSWNLKKDFFGRFFWNSTEDFDSSYHFQVANHGENISLDELHEKVSSMYSEPLDPSKPLWKLTYFPSVENDGHGVLVARFNHAIGDGIALIELLLTLLDGGLKSVKHPTRNHRRKRRVYAPNFFQKSWIFLNGVFFGLFGSVFPPDAPNALRLKDVYARGLPTAKKNQKKEQQYQSSRKCYAVSEKISIARFKQVKDNTNSTINDVCITTLTLAIQDTFKQLGDSDAAHRPGEFTVTFPISLRKSNGHTTGFRNGNPYNNFGLGQYALPLEVKSPLQCIRRCKRDLDKLKYSPAPMIQSFLVAVMSILLPYEKQVQLSYQASAQSSMFFSNVPGPTTTVKVADTVITDLSFVLFSPLGMYIGIISYNGKISLCVTLDEELNVDPKLICSKWVENFEKLEAAVL